MPTPKLIAAPYYEHNKDAPAPQKAVKSTLPYEPRGPLRAFYVSVGALIMGRITEHENMWSTMSGLLRVRDHYEYFWVPELITPEGRFRELFHPYRSGHKLGKQQAVDYLLKVAIDANLI